MRSGSCQRINCGNCSRPAALLLPDGSVQVQSRHGGATHYTVISVTFLVNALPISNSLRKQVLAELRQG